MGYSLAEIAASLGAEVLGDASLVIEGLAEPAMAGPKDLALASNEKYAEALKDGSAQAALLWPGADFAALGLKGAIVPNRPRYAMAGLTKAMDPGQHWPTGIHASAVVDPSAVLGTNVSVGAFTIVGPGAQIGDNCVIGPQSYIGAHVQLGPDAMIREQVSIGAYAKIGARFRAQPGARLAGDGFSYVTPQKSGVETARESLGHASAQDDQSWVRIHSLGSVLIGDDVEVGPNSCVDSGTIRPTQVGDGTKIDDLVQVAHNVVVGKNCLLCGLVGIAGSTVIGNNVVLGGQVGVSDNISIGDNVVAGGASVILSNVPAGRTILGYPATKMDAQIDSYKALRRLPRALRDIADLKKAVSKPDGSD
ncbi:UDP-3-O-(3-hydroxymyristoyl)glucosamine N-acyltransferase [uncultured Tateyamaria sp.]|uniref:UDP-3-O-(3-hydroxymyristoyl)glucosamine N-acyltransferase n=1 Tax=uncultured Tateyamaria sp. TaxID=455651 RepID=UPI00262550CC|nr:UDP-3-O-(3-hydroxymyristoyl)glucosamine N-acyltransferase [uncultured Tateyamaria sp.]